VFSARKNLVCERSFLSNITLRKVIRLKPFGVIRSIHVTAYPNWLRRNLISGLCKRFNAIATICPSLWARLPKYARHFFFPAYVNRIWVPYLVNIITNMLKNYGWGLRDVSLVLYHQYGLRISVKALKHHYWRFKRQPSFWGGVGPLRPLLKRKEG